MRATKSLPAHTHTFSKDPVHTQIQILVRTIIMCPILNYPTLMASELG